jgi:hypothetical protein
MSERSTSRFFLGSAQSVTRRTIASPWRSDILSLAHELIFGWLVTANWLILPIGEFSPEDAEIIRGVDTDPDTVTFDPDYGNGDVVADDHLLAGLPGQN